MQEFLDNKKAQETMNDADRVTNHPAKVIIKMEGMDLVISFRKLSNMHHIQSLQRIKNHLTQPPPTNALEGQALRLVTERIEGLETQADQRREEASKRREDRSRELRRQSRKP